MNLYGNQLKKPNTTIVECDFDEYFDQQIKELEKSALKDRKPVDIAKSLPEKSDSLGDEPPPLPGVISRGTR